MFSAMLVLSLRLRQYDLMTVGESLHIPFLGFSDATIFTLVHHPSTPQANVTLFNYPIEAKEPHASSLCAHCGFDLHACIMRYLLMLVSLRHRFPDYIPRIPPSRILYPYLPSPVSSSHDHAWHQSMEALQSTFGCRWHRLICYFPCLVRNGPVAAVPSMSAVCNREVVMELEEHPGMLELGIRLERSTDSLG